MVEGGKNAECTQNRRQQRKKQNGDEEASIPALVMPCTDKQGSSAKQRQARVEIIDLRWRRASHSTKTALALLQVILMASSSVGVVRQTRPSRAVIGLSSCIRIGCGL